MVGTAKCKEYITVRFSARTDTGRMRPANEDAFLADPGTGVFAVADGMGGHAAGEVASGLAIEVLRSRSDGGAAGSPPDIARKWLASRVDAANSAVYDAARSRPELRGMGTTLTALLLAPPVACYAHVGDSRLYRLRDGRLQQLTRDHTWVQEQVDAGQLSPEQARVHPHRSVLTGAVGINQSVSMDSGEIDVQPGDFFLIASDGLSGMLRDDEIVALLSSPATLDEIAEALVDEANARGGHDNITVVLVRVDD